MSTDVRFSGRRKSSPKSPRRCGQNSRIDGGIPARRNREADVRRLRLKRPAEDLHQKLKVISARLQNEMKLRKAAEAACEKATSSLAEEKAKADAIMASLDAGVMIHDANFRIMYQNDLHRDIFGNHIGKYCFEALYGSDRTCACCPSERSFTDGNMHRAEKSFPSTCGVVHGLITAFPLRDMQGDIVAGVEIVRDITGRKKIEDELREHREHLDFIVKDRTSELRKANKDLRAEIMRRIQMEKDLIESQRFVHRITNATPNILYLYDVAENQFIYINPRIREILGYSFEDIRRMGGAFLSTVLHPGDSATFGSLTDRLKNSDDGDIIETEYRMKNIKGEWRWFYSRDVVFKKTSDGLLKLVLGIAQDITERKLAEEELKKSREQLRSLLAHLQSVREEERTRISREIHDELGQTLTALKLDLSWIIKRLDSRDEHLCEKTRSMAKLIDMNIMTIKRIAAELRPGLLDNLGLAAALEWQAEEFQKRTGIPCDIHVTPNDIDLPRELSTAVFRIFQETLTNITRHANARHVSARLTSNGDEIVLAVKDDGKGIAEKQLTSPKSIGLIGMRERVHFLGGNLEIHGKKNKGTSVTVCIPLVMEKKR